MTGIERLRELVDGISPITVVCGVTRTSYDREHMEVAGKRLRDFLADIANQIEREQGERVSRVRILAVVTKMERHCLGHEGMEDSPVARWARELREALGGRDEEEVTDVATIRKDAMEAYEWMCEHGGLDAVKRRWECLSYYVDPVPRACMERRLASRQRQIDESHAALRRRNERIAELGHRVSDLTTENAELRRRAMPEDKEWPRYKDGAPVNFDDAVVDAEGFELKVKSFEFHPNGFTLHGEFDESHWYEEDDRLDYPAPKVLDADGAEIREKCDVWWICEGDERGVHAERLRVETIGPNGLIECSPYNGGTWVYLEPSELYVNEPVLAADGRPLREGETVWNVKTGERYVVVEPSYGKTVVVRLAKYDDAEGEQHAPDQLTHERPDSWERIEHDARKGSCDYFGYGANGCDGCPAYGWNVTRGGNGCGNAKMADLMRRAKALAGDA